MIVHSIRNGNRLHSLKCPNDDGILLDAKVIQLQFTVMGEIVVGYKNVKQVLISKFFFEIKKNNPNLRLFEFFTFKQKYSVFHFEFLVNFQPKISV